MFSCKFCKISFFTEHLWVTASVSVFHPAFFLPIKITLPTKAQKLPPEVLYEKTVLKILQYSQLCITPLLESLFNKVTGLQACNFIKRRLQHKCFHVKFAKFFRASFFYRTLPLAVCEDRRFLYGSLLLWTAKEYQINRIWMVQMLKNSENYILLLSKKKKRKMHRDA